MQSRERACQCCLPTPSLAGRVSIAPLVGASKAGGEQDRVAVERCHPAAATLTPLPPLHVPAGPHAQKLAAALVGHGMQTFPELLRTSALPPSQLKSALLVLAQHNCVNCYFHEEPPTLRGPGPSYQLYEAATDRILQIIRHVARPTGGARGGPGGQAGADGRWKQPCATAPTRAALLLCRAPRFLTHVGDEMGSLAELVVHKLLENGRLRWGLVGVGVGADAS